MPNKNGLINHTMFQQSKITTYRFLAFSRCHTTEPLGVAFLEQRMPLGWVLLLRSFSLPSAGRKDKSSQVSIQQTIHNEIRA
jgi:hypothetical protein